MRRALNRLPHGLRGFLQSRSEGGALVEMALTLPIMMLMITGMTSFGLLLNSYLVLSHATDVGARALAVSRGMTSTPCSDTVTVIENAAPNLGSSNLTFTFVIDGNTYTGANITGTGSGGCSNSSNGMTAGATATVTVSYPFLLTVYGWTPTTMSLQASTAEVIQ